MTEALYVPTPTTRLSTIKAWRDTWRRRWTDASQTTRTWIQVGVLLGAVLIAYNYSLSTLLQTVNEQTPLAYISLVPAIALALAVVRSRPLKPEPPIYDRQVDYTIGIPLILAAVAINELLPARLSALFWFYRVDLFSLPIFVAGAVAIIFGCRVLWRQKLAIAFLFLAWPYPYEKYLLGVLNAFTDLTLAAMDKIAVWTHLATPTLSSDNAPVRGHSPRHDFFPQHRVRVLGSQQYGRLSAGRLGLRRHRPWSHCAQGPVAHRRDTSPLDPQRRSHHLHLFRWKRVGRIHRAQRLPSIHRPRVVLRGPGRHALVDQAPRNGNSDGRDKRFDPPQGHGPRHRFLQLSRRGAEAQGDPRSAQGLPCRLGRHGGSPCHRSQQCRTH